MFYPHRATYLYILIPGLPQLLDCLQANTKQFMVAIKTNTLLDRTAGAGKTTLTLDQLSQLVQKTGVTMVHLRQRMRNCANIGRVAPADMRKYTGYA